MKSIKFAVIFFVAQLLLNVSCFGQTPEKMSYQAIVRNASNELIVNESVGMQISILKNGATGTAVYVERHTPTTNSNGLVSLEIGTGTVTSGDFSTIDWANGVYFVKTETDVDGGTNYTISGTSQLLTVPYALHAKTVEEKQTLSITGNKLTISDGNEVTLPSGGVGTNSGGHTYLVLTGDITDVEAVEKMKTDLGPRTQFVIIRNTTNLTNLDFSGYGISELLEVEIEGNESLQTVNLPDLKTVLDDVSYQQNKALINFSMPLLETTSAFSFYGNEVMKDFSLPHIIKMESLMVEDNQSLTSISCPNLREIINFEISNSSALSTLNMKLTDVRYLSISGSKLTSIDLSTLDEVDRIGISGNDQLTELLLPMLAKVTFLNVDNNVGLELLDLPSLIEINTGQFSGNNFSSMTINSLLAHFVAINMDDGSLYFRDQETGASPTGQGIIDYQTLEGRGIDVFID